MVEYFSRTFCRPSFIKRLQSKKNKYFLWQKSSSISSGLLDKTFYVYTGSKFVSVPVMREAIGRKFGNLSLQKR